MKVTKIPTIEKSKPRVCAYVRISTDRQAQEDSFAFQSDYWHRKFSENSDVEYMGLFADEGVSGKSMRNRKGLNEMLEQVRNGKIDRIYTKSISRFARNYTELMAVVRELRDISIPIVFEKENIDTLDPKCGLILSVMASLAEEELRSMSKNQQWAARKRFQNGIPEFKRTYGYEYKNGRFTIIPKEAEIVKQVFHFYLQGNGIVKVAQLMDESGYKPMMGGEKWANSTIRNILKNEKYIGDSLLQKYVYELKKGKPNRGELPQYYVEGTHEAIISKGDFEEVQKKLKEATEKFYPHYQLGASLYPLSGKIKCGCCGETYKRKTYAKGKTYESIKWSCQTKDLKTKAACASNDIKDVVIKTLLVEAFNECLDSKGAFENTKLERRLQRLLSSERELKVLKVKGYVSEQQYRTEAEHIVEEIKILESQRKETNAKNINLSKFEKSAEFNKEMADFLLQATIIDWTVTFRFKNGFEVTKNYTNGRPGNVNGKLCKHKTKD